MPASSALPSRVFLGHQSTPRLQTFLNPTKSFDIDAELYLLVDDGMRPRCFARLLHGSASYGMAQSPSCALWA